MTPGMERLGSAAFAASVKPQTPQRPFEVTDANGDVRLLHPQTGEVIATQPKAGKPGATHADPAGSIVTDDQGNSRLVNTRTGEVIKELGKIGRTTQPPSFQFVPTEAGIQAMNPKNPTAPPINTGLQPPPSAATQAGRREAQSGVNAIDDAEQAVKKAPGAFGYVQGKAGASDLGSAILNNPEFSTPADIAARAKVANIGSQILHDRSGANVTISEAPRLKPFIPLPSDSAEVIKVKLAQLRKRMADDGYSFGAKPGSLDKREPTYRLKPGANPKLKSSYEAIP